MATNPDPLPKPKPDTIEPQAPPEQPVPLMFTPTVAKPRNPAMREPGSGSAGRDAP